MDTETKQLHIYPNMADVTWVKLSKDLFAQKRWNALIRSEGKDKTGKNVKVLNLTGNSWPYSHHFNK